MTRPRRTPQQRDALRRRASADRLRDPEFDQSDPAIQHAPLFIEGLPAASTTATYATGLVKWFRWCRDRHLRPFEAGKAQAKIFLAGLGHLAPRTRASQITAVRSFYASALDNDLIDRSPFDRVYPKGARAIDNAPALTQALFEDVLSVIERHIHTGRPRVIHRRDFAIVYLAGRIGPRRVSLGHCRVRDVKLENGVTFLKLRLKGDRYDRVALPPDVADVLWWWLAQLSRAIGRELRPGDGVFPPVGPHALRLHGYDGGAQVEPMVPQTFSYQITNRLADAGIVGARWSAHALRATAATIAHENGASVEEIQRMLAHLNRQQTEAYIRRHNPQSAARYWVPRTGRVARFDVIDGTAA